MISKKQTEKQCLPESGREEGKINLIVWNEAGEPGWTINGVFQNSRQRIWSVPTQINSNFCSDMCWPLWSNSHALHTYWDVIPHSRTRQLPCQARLTGYNHWPLLQRTQVWIPAPDPGNPTAFSGLHGHQAHTQYTYNIYAKHSHLKRKLKKCISLSTDGT